MSGIFSQRTASGTFGSSATLSFTASGGYLHFINGATTDYTLLAVSVNGVSTINIPFVAGAWVVLPASSFTEYTLSGTDANVGWLLSEVPLAAFSSPRATQTVLGTAYPPYVVPWILVAPLNTVGEMDLGPVPNGQIWELLGYAQGPSANVAGNFNVWDTNAKVRRLMPQVMLATAGIAPTSLNRFLLQGGNYVSLNVTTAGADTAIFTCYLRRVV